MKFKIIFFFLITICSHGQVLSVDYNFALIDVKDEYGVVGFGVERLITNSKESLSYSKSKDTIVVLKNRAENHTQDASAFSTSRYKNFIIGECYSATLFPSTLLRDNNYKIKWTITKGTKKILGYNCQEAKGDYRGRSYTAYFASGIPIQNGPHNFDGLPGLILEVFSNDNIVHYTAFQIVKTNEKIENPYITSKYISWEQFTKAYKQYFEKMINYKPEEDVIFIVPNRGIEIYTN